MRYPLVFFSFVEVNGDAGAHRRYNEWHQLDHRPENLALPGVAWGDRWALTKNRSVAAPEYESVDYIAMYWFNEPVERSLDEWHTLGTDSFQWGRGPRLPGVHRPLLGFFRPVKGYVSPSAQVSPEGLPYRPNRGLHVTLTRFDEAYGADTHDHHQWEDRVLVPQLLDLDGVAGVWTFAFERHQQSGSMSLGEPKTDAPGSMRMRVVYLDGEPSETTKRIRSVVEDAELGTGSSAESETSVLLDAEATTIVPWQDW